ncbi:MULTISPECIES: hypothetical protein [Streptomyces]|nr:MULTISPECIES: hypothetical protein [Streptomyces]PIB05076.1 hypothetical protein B1C81_30695 [Streptomyces sp. HG99]
MSSSETTMKVPAHAERYLARTGRHPYTDCWPWAEAALAWSRANEQNLGWSLRNACLDDGDIEHVPAAVAETLRLSMVRHNRLPADLAVETARNELGYWAEPWATNASCPEPGTPGWPEPTGPYADRWRAAFLSGDPRRTRRLATAADHVLLGLLFHTAKAMDRGTALRYRTNTYNSSYTAVADTAPIIGITTPVTVRDPLAYQGIDGLTAVPEAA